jgi:hypothetical protein
MKEHRFIARRSKIIKQTSLIWLFVLIHIILNFMITPKLISNGQYTALLLINLGLSLLSIPGVYLFFNYYRHSINKEFILTYNTVRLIDHKTKEVIELLNNEIVMVTLNNHIQSSRLPWLFNEYFCLTDRNGKNITITSWIMDISDLWTNTLSRRINNDNIVKNELVFPVIKTP